MNKTIFLVALAALSFSACELLDPESDWEINHRTPVETPFVRRSVPSGFTIGANKPSGVEAVDLGLSVKWANMNLGETASNKAGDLYAWGEITPSGNYSWQNYEHNDFDSNKPSLLFINKYCFDKYGLKQDIKQGGVNLDKYDDAAYMQWGEGWRMPTMDEFNELITKCTWTADMNTKIITITGSNGNSITMPYSSLLAGISGDAFPYNNQQGVVYSGYWTSTLDTNNSFDAAIAHIEILKGTDKDGKMIDEIKAYIIPRQNRCFGLPIRPVFSEK